MTTSVAAYKDGLEDIIAARSAICRVDGEAGRLYYRGYEIADLVGTASFEDTTRLLWVGELPSAAERVEFAARLAETRPLPPPVLDLLRRLPRECHPLDALRTAVSLAAASDPDVRSDEPAANLRKAYRLMNLVPATVAAWQRIRTGREPVAARPDGSHAANFLYMLDGKAPSAEVARILDVILTLHADHEFNASTFAARVAVATVADMHSAVVAAISTLKGPRHGGANEDVLAMLLEIAEPSLAEAFVEARIGARAGLSKRDRANPKSRMPGFGHRVYKVDDARARVLRGMAMSMAVATGRGKLFEVAERLY
ncbi:MAG: citrate/2-methylcitrate synthase, partial [Candidatus Rokuibacteriota bacterium]